MNYEFKGTPGPWKVTKWEGEEWPERRISISKQAGWGLIAVAITPRYNSFNEETEANFKLISKAPEMFEMLKKNL